MASSIPVSGPELPPGDRFVKPTRFAEWRFFLRDNITLLVGGVMLTTIVLIAIFAPMLGTVDPTRLSPVSRLRAPSANFWFGTDALGRDLYSRVIFGSRLSLMVGISVAGLSIVAGTFIGLVAGFFQTADHFIMRVVEAIMAIPPILLAIAMIALMSPGVQNVILALVIAETPRVARLVRAIVLSQRERPYVEAAVAIGMPTWLLLFRHILPNSLTPLIVQGTFIFGSAILAEATLSFIGAGTPPSIPTWGNIISDGANYFQLMPGIIAFPAIFLSMTVLSINLLGDGLRDLIDPRMSRSIR